MYALNEKITPRCIEEEMKDSYINYAMSVIVGRALPDIRDGLKPVHRRVLYAMRELGLEHNKPYKKSARIVGEALGKYHPHGDASIYDTLVRMAQSFSLRYPLVDGQGNFGCFTKDTKVKLSDGRSLSFTELIKEYREGKKNYTFAFNSATKRVEIAEILHPRRTKKNAAIMKVVFDNKEEIKCTLNHKFMLKSGEYKEAQFLEPGDSLMPIYTRMSSEKDDPNIVGYEMIYQPAEDKWDWAHHLADEWNIRNNAYTKSAGRIRHHIDYNKLNNYEKVRSGYGSRDGEGIVKYEKAVAKYLNGDGSRVSAFLSNQTTERAVNHKVVGVEFIKETEDVFDLTVENTHNFALAAGVFVHNSIDGDSAAAMRYTEARLEHITDWMLLDIDKNTVDFAPNFDGSLEEPTVLPSCLPNLLVNGSSGIAVGMATNIPPHNLKEVADAITHIIENPACEPKELLKKIKGPDFPTGGIIKGYEGIRNAYLTGRGLLKIHAKAYIEEMKSGKEAIVIKEIPYMVNKSNLIESIADLVQDKKIDGITDLRDESDKDGMRIVIELRRGTIARVVLNLLYKHTQMQQTFGVIMLALVDGRPRVLNLKDMLAEFIKHRKDIIVRRTRFDLEKAQDRAHILEGLKIALKNLDRIIKLIRESKDPQAAKAGLMGKFELSDKQAQAILEMQLQRLTNLEREKIDKEYLELIKKIEYYKSILDSEKLVLEIIKDETKELAEKFGDGRRTEIAPEAEELEIEDLIAEEDVVITMSHGGYIKRLPISSYRKQHRGGRGVAGADIKEEDFIEHLFVASTHDSILFFTDKGVVHWLKVHEIPEAGRSSKGKAIINLLTIGSGEKTSAFVPVREYKEGHFLVMATKCGAIKKTDLQAYANPRKGGIIGMGLEKDDELIGVEMTSGSDEILLATREGKAIRFKEEQVRDMGRSAKGVRGIRLGKKDSVIAMEIVRPEQTVLTVTGLGFGKRTLFKEYRLQSRGGKGIINIKVTGKNGQAVGLKTVSDKDELMLVTEKGMVVRWPVKDVRTTGRSTQGVRLMKLDAHDTVASMAKIVPEDEAEKVAEANPAAIPQAGVKAPEPKAEAKETKKEPVKDAASEKKSAAKTKTKKIKRK